MEEIMMRFCSCRKSGTLFLLSSLVALTVLVVALTAYAADTGVSAISKVPIGATIYTQFSMFYEHNTHKTTNYRKGTLVPVNTAVKFVKSDSYTISVKLPDGQDLTIDNVADFSGEKIDGIFARTFSTKPLNLSIFTEAERKSIMAGEVKPGMRKSAVIVALGYPPKHKTPNLELNEWRYWINRFNTFIVRFEKDRVTGIQN
jgi:hypothetical protein